MLAGALDGAMQEFFRLITTTKRETDQPWINHQVRKMTMRCRKIYDRWGRSRVWRKMKKEVVELIKRRAAAYIESQKKNFFGKDAARNFFKNVRAINSKEKPKQFDVRNMFPDCPDEEVAEKVTDQFGSINSKFPGLDEGYNPSQFTGTIPVLTREEVEKRLMEIRKPKSRVQGW